MKRISQNLVQLVALLNDGHYHDGTSIGEQLNVSRAAVWKLIKKLEQYDVPIASTKGKGYQLKKPLALLDNKKLASLLRHRSVKVETLEKVASTNDYLKQFTKDNDKIIACMSETQTKGKGRLQRQWHSPFGQNIYLSLLCPFEKDISELSGLSLVAGLAVCHAIESTIDLRGNQLKMKWPNDIFIDGRKLGGILIEIEAESNGFCQVVIGVGLNVNMEKALKREIDQSWASLLQMTEQYIDRNKLCAEIIDSIIDYFERFSSKGLAEYKSEWQKRDCLSNKNISVMSGNKKMTGACIGINNQGHLKIQDKSGKTSTLSSGDTTLLK
ncbi:MAG: biotin--[acetyl-CoA-carboxylase] ligase [Legionellaceae bacterium]|nr:biotin--[acetyl-CoA-carboxylase] ligase [Legionellaceae bacterium]